MVTSLENWWHNSPFRILIGLAGVDRSESASAKMWNRIFSYGAMLVAITLLLQWELQLFGHLSKHQNNVFNFSIWGYFILQFCWVMALVKNKLLYMKRNWLLPLVIVVGVAIVFNHRVSYFSIFRWLEDFRPLLALAILIPTVALFIRFFTDGQLKTTLLASFLIVVIFGLLVAGVDPNIKTPWDGIWWAIATVSTVGFGDVVPTSLLGRLLGAGLMILGLGIFVVITANFLALILKKEVAVVREEEEEIISLLEELKDIKNIENANEEALHDIVARLERIEQKINQQRRDRSDRE